MRIILQSWSMIELPNPKTVMFQLEGAARTCYKSEEKMGDYEESKTFIQGIIKLGHHSVLEHFNISVRIITDRGVSHELVRHRLAAYSQESTRYCDYGRTGEITVVEPVWLYDMPKLSEDYQAWESAMLYAEAAYFRMRRLGWGPEKARDVLPHSLKTEIVMTANIREWRHIFELRTTPKAHPQMRDLMLGMLRGFQAIIPVVFDDIEIGESR